jgi:hypothetical protein
MRAHEHGTAAVRHVQRGSRRVGPSIQRCAVHFDFDRHQAPSPPEPKAPLRACVGTCSGSFVDEQHDLGHVSRTVKIVQKRRKASGRGAWESIIYCQTRDGLIANIGYAVFDIGEIDPHALHTLKFALPRHRRYAPGGEN